MVVVEEAEADRNGSIPSRVAFRVNCSAKVPNSTAMHSSPRCMLRKGSAVSVAVTMRRIRWRLLRTITITTTIIITTRINDDAAPLFFPFSLFPNFFFDPIPPPSINLLDPQTGFSFFTHLRRNSHCSRCPLLFFFPPFFSTPARLISPDNALIAPYRIRKIPIHHRSSLVPSVFFPFLFHHPLASTVVPSPLQATLDLSDLFPIIRPPSPDADSSIPLLPPCLHLYSSFAGRSIW